MVRSVGSKHADGSKWAIFVGYFPFYDGLWWCLKGLPR